MIRFLWVLFTVLLMSQVSLAEDIICESKNDRWFMSYGGKPFGQVDHATASTTKESCQSMADTRHGSVACAWNGMRFQPYHIENNRALGTEVLQNHYQELEHCHQGIKAQPSTSPYLCAWNGKSFSPYNRVTNVQISGAHGWDDITSCVKSALTETYQSLLCSWNSGYYAYNSQGDIVSLKMKSSGDCMAFIKSLNATKKDQKFSDNLTQQFTKMPQNTLPIKNGAPDLRIGFSAWKKCEVKDHNYHLTKNTKGILDPECSPDTLYSWGSYEKIAWFLENLSDKDDWSGALPRGLFTVHSPAATFGYGQIPMRIKIKPHVKFKLLVNPQSSTCEGLKKLNLMTDDEATSTIFTRIRLDSDSFSFLEHLVCSKDVIESWSFGTAEHYDEILRDHTWMTTQHVYNWESYLKRDGIDSYIGTDIDKQQYETDFSIQNFNNQMNYLRILSTNEYGKVSAEKGNKVFKKRHFNTTKPIYFNPD